MWVSRQSFFFLFCLFRIAKKKKHAETIHWVKGEINEQSEMSEKVQVWRGLHKSFYSIVTEITSCITL